VPVIICLRFCVNFYRIFLNFFFNLYSILS
jgi:hypothetical protein